MYKQMLVMSSLLIPVSGIAQDTPKTQEGTASYWNKGEGGNTVTKSGEKVDPTTNTAAHPTLPMGTEATVTNQNTGKSTDVKINDRGPTAPGRDIDVSRKAADDLGMIKSGTAPVTITVDPNKQTEAVKDQLQKK